jgi:hypothetical protein
MITDEVMSEEKQAPSQRCSGLVAILEDRNSFNGLVEGCPS